jgi:hypothetical protein
MAGSRLNRQLGDTHLNPEEVVIREREALLNILNKRNMSHHDELIKADRSIGVRMLYNDLISRLKKLYPPLLVRDGIEGSVALYRLATENEMSADGYDLGAPQWYNEHRYIIGLPKDPLPEWGHLMVDTDNRATCDVNKKGEGTRGWRSVLIAFIKSGVITYDAAVKEFGDPATDSRSNVWFETLNEYRLGSKIQN